MAQQAADNLAGCRHRQRRNEFDLTWILVRRKARLHVALQFVHESLATIDVIVRYDEDLDDFSSQGIGYPDHGRETHRRAIRAGSPTAVCCDQALSNSTPLILGIRSTITGGVPGKSYRAP